MPLTLQVLYPVSSDSTFDFAYYTETHLALVMKHMGPHIQSAQAVKGLAGGPDTPAGYHAVATMIFADKAALDAGLAVADPVLADIPNYTNVAPQMLIGEVLN